VQILFAQNDGAGVLQPAYDVSVFRRNAVFEQGARRSGTNAGCIDEIFESERDPMQRAAPISTANFTLGLSRFLKRHFGSDRDECVQAGIQPLDAFEAVVSKFKRRHRAFAEQLGSFENGMSQ